jgi:DNA invertase Pin-like site-specific DNA recombinase
MTDTAPAAGHRTRASSGGGVPGSRKRIRCAIYTRKSSEEGLEQEFNSLDAQREACEAYIKSQRHEGWIVLPAFYDDPAYSGGNMERPALRRLLADIDASLIDNVVVYKVDRLTRSLADFAKIVEAFDARSVSFVSVTQAFNTTTNMGRLTLNVLLSFAQFEREVTGERIRDKIAASKKKGMWMGGLPPLGYDVRDRKLVINEPEADTVRHIFRRYCALGSVRALQEELDACNLRSKQRMASDGTPYGAKPFSRGALYQLLQNRLYLGEITHKGASYPGEHQAILDPELWASAQGLLQSNRIERGGRNGSKDTKPLTGILFDADGAPMSPSHAVKKDVRYRYYVSRSLILDKQQETSSGQRIPAPALEALVVERIAGLLREPKAVLDALPVFYREATRQQTILCNIPMIQRSLEQGPSAAWTILHKLLLRVQVHSDEIEIDLSREQLANLLMHARDDDASLPANSLRPMQRTFFGEDRASENVSCDPIIMDDADDEADDVLKLIMPAQLKRTGKELKFVIPGAPSANEPDASLVRLLVRAKAIQTEMEAAASATIEEISKRQGVTPSYAARLVRLNYLAPDIVEAILAGAHPADLTANKLMKDTRFALSWREQRRALGFEVR